MKLAVFKGSRGKNDVVISCVPYAIGRCRSADFIIAHVNVSRNHCKIVKEAGLWKISDFSSSGTYVNDALVGRGTTVVLNNGDRVRFGPPESNLCWTFYLFDSAGENTCPLHVRHENAEVLKSCNEKCGSEEKSFPDGVISCSKRTDLASEDDKRDLKNLDLKFERAATEFELKVTDQNIETNNCSGKNIEQCLPTNNPDTDEKKSEREKIKKLTRELQEVQTALNNLEEKNSVLQVKLAAGIKDEAGTNKTKNFIENFADVMEAEFQCTICSELFVTAVTLSCTHTFCKYCISQWKKKQKTCPICRKKITSETRSLVVDNYIDKVVGNLSVELKERREIIIKERNEIVPCKKKSKVKSSKF